MGFCAQVSATRFKKSNLICQPRALKFLERLIKLLTSTNHQSDERHVQIRQPMLAFSLRYANFLLQPLTQRKEDIRQDASHSMSKAGDVRIVKAMASKRLKCIFYQRLLCLAKFAKENVIIAKHLK